MAVEAAPVSEALSSDALHLILLPTEACNFRCTYCYEDFRLGQMPEPVVQGVEQLLTRRAQRLRRLDVAWFGGEPLLAKTTVLRLLRHIQGLRAGVGAFTFRSDMTTNGALLSVRLFEELHELGVERYQISFDGLADEHDRKRLRRSGMGTFQTLWQNLLNLRQLPLSFTIMVRLHVDQRNEASLPGFVDRLQRDFAGDPRFVLFPKLLGRWGGLNDAGIAVFDPNEAPRALERVKEMARARGVPLYASQEKGVICYAARGNSFVIRSDGRVNKCTIALEAPENQVGRIKPDGRLVLDATRVAPWMRGLWTNTAEELHCPMKGLVERLSQRATAGV